MRILLFALGALVLTGCAVVPQAPASFDVTTTKPEDDVVVSEENGTAIFDVTSPSGIGSARVTRTSGAMPKNILFRLHLQGLEHFSFAFEDEVIEVSIPSGGEQTPMVLNQNAGPSSANPLDASSPLWMPAKIVSANPEIPLKDSYFEIQAPRAFLESDASSFALEWIDFYR
jgi:hypothetical protein